MSPQRTALYVFILIQALLLAFVIKIGLRPQDVFNIQNHIHNVWTRWKNNSQAVDPEADVFGMIDLKKQQLSWLKNSAKNVTRSTHRHIETTSPNSRSGNKILKPVINHGQGEIFLMVVVTTVPKSFETRKLIRNTWAKLSHTSLIRLNSGVTTNFTLYIVFMVGLTGELEQDKALEKEAEKYGDILRGPYRESYENLIIKVWYAFEWAHQYQPKYILKVDDDVYVRIPRYVSWVSEGKTPSKLYSGFVHYRAYIDRNPKSLHFVNRSIYNGPVFPNYCAGPCYTISGNFLGELLKMSKSVPKFKVEDAYLGLLAEKAGVKPYDMGGSLFVWDRSLSNTVSKWTDQQLSKVVCLGDSLTLEAIKYIDNRFKKIDQSNKLTGI